MAAPLGAARDVQDAWPTWRARHLQAEILRARHVPLPKRRRVARRASRGLHSDGHRREAAEDAGPQRAPPYRLGRVRAAGGAVRHPDGDAPRGDDGALFLLFSQVVIGLESSFFFKESLPKKNLDKVSSLF